jgi:enoyl-CoA hydratase/3-hydroxyacyl-CoA dehydrogenase
LRPSPIQEAKVEAGELGRKTGTGFYRYAEGKRLGEADRPTAPLDGAHFPPAKIRGRILDAIAAEATFAADEGIATPDVIDLALRLGAGHPHGPFESRRSPT